MSYVFGSYLNGSKVTHYLFKKFGADWRKNQSFSISTIQGSVEEMKPYVDEFISFAEWQQGLYFYVGIDGFKDKEIAPLFKKASGLINVALPENFMKYINL